MTGSNKCNADPAVSPPPCPACLAGVTVPHPTAPGGRVPLYIDPDRQYQDRVNARVQGASFLSEVDCPFCESGGLAFDEGGDAAGYVLVLWRSPVADPAGRYVWTDGMVHRDDLHGFGCGTCPSRKAVRS
jgi:hypothetical protein